ncbi:MAG: PspC domain-containing protein [Thermomicrobiales bacterium]|nr:PspC domain-containing protein [Thermomicrobiales bacterium]
MTKSRHNKRIFGVCAGIANQLGISTFWVRLFTVLAAAVIPGVSFLMVLAAYLTLALVLPFDDESRTFAR